MPLYNGPYVGPSNGQMSYGMSGYTQVPQYQQIPMQQSYAPQQTQPLKVMEWVEGEIGAKAFQMPAGWPPNTPIPLWDSTDTVIYLKSINHVGMPNPMQKLKYTIEGQTQQPLLSGNSEQDMSQYVTKRDFEQLRNEIRSMNNGGNSGNTANPGINQNGSNSGQNGGNRGASR